MRETEWPEGFRLFSEGGFHMSFDPPEGADMPAIVFKVEGDLVTILAVRAFKTDADAMQWFAEQRAKFGH